MVPLSMNITSPAVRFVVDAQVIVVAPAATVPVTASALHKQQNHQNRMANGNHELSPEVA